MTESPAQIKSFDFALAVIRLYKQLQTKHEYVISRQLLRSGTSIG
ncbi:MAG TPA: four helix bundle protein, partial [Candidatus Binatia bacterium]